MKEKYKPYILSICIVLLLLLQVRKYALIKNPNAGYSEIFSGRNFFEGGIKYGVLLLLGAAMYGIFKLYDTWDLKRKNKRKQK